MHTQIICSIGPSTDSDEKIKALIENGMNVARLNFSHDTQSSHAERIKRIRFWANKLKKDVKILCDLQGPKIRIADFSNPPKKIVEGKKYSFATLATKELAEADVLINDRYLHGDLKKGDTILIDDGQIELVVTDLQNQKIIAKAIRGNDLYPRKGVNVPLTHTTTNSITDKDISDLAFIIKQKPEWIALSFVQAKEDVLDLKNRLGKNPIKVMCKIERASAIKNLDEIIDAADAIMVARGDLGSELPIEKLPVIQKHIITRANLAGKPVVTATQMLASMVDALFPTRAEVTDIANAILDGTDAIMLSNETTIGKYPIEALSTMRKIASETEKYLFHETQL